MTPMEQVIIVSGQPIPNLIPMLEQRPEAVHMLVSGRMIPQADRLRRFFEGLNITVHQLAIDPYNMDEVEAKCRWILADKEPGSVLLNVTGGTKLAALAAYSTFRELGFPVIYFEPEKWQTVQLFPKGVKATPSSVQLSVEDYLGVYGLNVHTSQGGDEGLRRRASVGMFLASELPRRPKFMRMLNAVASEVIVTGKFPGSLRFVHFDPSAAYIMERLHHEGIVTWQASNQTIVFPDLESARFLNGFWLEEHVFQTISELAPFDVRRNIEVEWDGTGREPVRNEFDVAFTVDARLYLVSCKTAGLAHARDSLNKNPVYELDSLKDAAGGLFGKGLLISASPLSQALQQRASASGIGCIEGEELVDLERNLQRYLYDER